MKRKAVRLAPLLAAALVIGCSYAQERSVLARFFDASRLRDLTALATLATVVFEPLQDGIVTRFEIVDVSSHQDDRKTVTIQAPVKVPDGRILNKTMTLSLERRNGRWIVTAFRM
jgi:hypothetical protein